MLIGIEGLGGSAMAMRCRAPAAPTRCWARPATTPWRAATATTNLDGGDGQDSLVRPSRQRRALWPLRLDTLDGGDGADLLDAGEDNDVLLAGTATTP